MSEAPQYQQGTGFLLSRLGTLVGRFWSSLLSRHGLTQAQYTAMVVLGESGPLGQGRLAELIAVDPRNVVSVVNGLVASGWAERRADPTDGRRRQIALTAKGQRLNRVVAADAATTQGDFLAALNRDEQSSLNRLLQRVYENLTDQA